MRVAKVARVRWAKVDFRLVQGVGYLVREDACRETRHDFLDFEEVGRV